MRVQGDSEEQKMVTGWEHEYGRDAGERELGRDQSAEGVWNGYLEPFLALSGMFGGSNRGKKLKGEELKVETRFRTRDHLMNQKISARVIKALGFRSIVFTRRDISWRKDTKKPLNTVSVEKNTPDAAPKQQCIKSSLRGGGARTDIFNSSESKLISSQQDAL